MFGITQRSGFSVMAVLLLADVGGLQYAKPFGIGGHDPVFDAVVYHLHEVTSTVGPAVQVAFFGRAGCVSTAARCRWDISLAGRERGEDGIQPLDDLRLAAEHHVVAA